MAKAIDLEMKGDIEKSLTAIGKAMCFKSLFVTLISKCVLHIFTFLFLLLLLFFNISIVKCAGCRPAYFAERLHGAMEVKSALTTS